MGRAIKKSGLPREEIFLETKLWPAFYEQEDAVEKTLERLDTEYIDLLLIHQPAGNYVAGYRQMEKAYKAGKVKAIGLSNFSMEQIREILGLCEVRHSVLQTEVHPYAQEKELKEFLEQEKIVIQAWYPLGHGDAALIEEPVFGKLAEKYGKTNALTEDEMAEIAALNQEKHYYTSTPEMLQKYAEMVPPVDTQK